jgi:hypothetical protein
LPQANLHVGLSTHRSVTSLTPNDTGADTVPSRESEPVESVMVDVHASRRIGQKNIGTTNIKECPERPTRCNDLGYLNE